MSCVLSELLCRSLLPYNNLFSLSGTVICAELFFFICAELFFFLGGDVIAGVFGACFFTTQVPALQKLIGDRVLVDLLAQMLEYDPDRRITADKALLVVSTTIVTQVYACVCVFLVACGMFVH